MRYLTTLTQKGQMTVPKAVRERLRLATPSKVILDFDEGDCRIRIEPAFDIIDIAGELEPDRTVSATEIREQLESGYGNR